MANNPRIKLPDSAKVGEVIEVKTLVTHVMETGQRKDRQGNIIPRDIISQFVATYGDEEVFRATLGPGISANPYISFKMRVPGPGTFSFVWTDDVGRTIVAAAELNVTP